MLQHELWGGCWFLVRRYLMKLCEADVQIVSAKFQVQLTSELLYWAAILQDCWVQQLLACINAVFHPSLSLATLRHCELLRRAVLALLQDTAHAEVQVLRSGMLSAETERDQALLRLEALQLALAASSDDAVKAALQQDAAAAAGRPASSIGGSQADAALDPTAAEQQQQPAGGIMGDLGVVAGLRARVSELEFELRQVRSLQRMTSSVLVRGMSSGGMGLGRASMRGARARGSSNAGGGGAAAAGAGAHGNRGNSRHGSPPHPHAAAGLGISLEGVSLEEEDEDACSPMTPARQAADELDEPLVVSVVLCFFS